MRLELQGITKRFPGVVANDDISLTVEPGEVHGLLGENGAGKSTLMNILYGLYHADEGRILIDGEPVSFEDPGDAIDAGIGMVHQHFMLVPVFTVAENITLGVEPARAGGRLDRRRAAEAVEELGERFGLPVDPSAIVEDLPVGVQQRVEILKALYRDAELLILDEPTAVLTPGETDDLFEAVQDLVDAGMSVIFISHKLREHLQIADRISVLRGGALVGTTTPDEADESTLAEMMVGRPVMLEPDRTPPRTGEPVLEVSGLSVPVPGGGYAVRDVTFTLHRGEIVALAGIEGNGQSELVRALTGLQPDATGSVRLRGEELLGRSRKEVLRAGVGHVPEDRGHDGIIGALTVAENLMLNLWDVPPYARGRSLDLAAIRDHAETEVADFDIRTPGVSTPAGSLSGGNQQKVVVGREFDRDIDVLVASQPTRGIDVGSIEYIHEQLLHKRDQGTAVLLVSSELDEVLALGDRIAVMSGGRLIGPLRTPVERETCGRLMAGSDPEEVLAGRPGFGPAAAASEGDGPT